MTKSAHFPGLRWAVLLLGAFALFDSQMIYLSAAPLLEPIAHSLSIHQGAATIVLMSAFLAAASVAWLTVGGYLCDRFGVLVPLLLALFVLAAPPALTPWVGGGATGVLWLRIVEGFSMGFAFPAIPAIANTLFPPRQRGLASGLLSSAVALGNSAGAVFGPMLFSALGGDWRRMEAALSLFGWACLIFGAVLYVFYNNKLPKAQPVAADAGQREEFRQALFTPLSLLGIVASFLTVFSLQGVYSVVPTFLAAARPMGAGYGALTGGQLMLGATLVGGGLGPILNGLLLDRVFHGRVKWNLYIGFSLMCLCVLLLKLPAVAGNVGVLEPLLIVAGLAPMLTFPTMFYLSACSYPAGIVGKMGGLWSGVGNCGGFLCTYCAGLMIGGFGDYQPTFTLQASVSALGLVFTYFLVKQHKRIYLSSRLAVQALGAAAD